MPSNETLAPGGKEEAAALIVLNPAEAKRLIAKAVAVLPEVKKAMSNGIVMISRGITDAFVLEELMGEKVEKKGEFSLGCIASGELTVNQQPSRTKPYIVRSGKVVDMASSEALRNLTPGDVFIRGANAVDRDGNAAVLVSSPNAGSIGEALPSLLARGCSIIVPVGLEKLVPSVEAALPKCHLFRFKYATGLPAALIPLPNAKVVTEVQALQVLCGVKSIPVASGGIGGSEGASVLAVEGSAEGVESAFELIKSIKGEPPVAAPEKLLPRAAQFGYRAQEFWSEWRKQMAQRPAH